MKLTKLTLVIAAAATFAALSLASGVTVIQGQGTAQAINQAQFAGSGTVRVGRTTVTETSLATITSLAPGSGGTLVGTSTHTLTLGTMGTLVTSDEVLLVPVNAFGLYVLQIRSQIVGGTGDFAGATGSLHFNGFANLATGEVSWRIHGSYR